MLGEGLQVHFHRVLLKYLDISMLWITARRKLWSTQFSSLFFWLEISTFLHGPALAFPVFLHDLNCYLLSLSHMHQVKYECSSATIYFKEEHNNNTVFTDWLWNSFKVVGGDLFRLIPFLCFMFGLKCLFWYCIPWCEWGQHARGQGKGRLIIGRLLYDLKNGFESMKTWN